MSEKDREKKAQEEENQHDGERAVENIVAGTYETYLIAENGIRQYPNVENIASVDGIVRTFFPLESKMRKQQIIVRKRTISLPAGEILPVPMTVRAKLTVKRNLQSLSDFF